MTLTLTRSTFARPSSALTRRRARTFERITIIITMRPTADLDGACARLKRALHRARFHALSPSRPAGTRIDTDLKRGDGRLFVRVLRHALCARSRAVARVIADRGHDLAGVESPLRFVERAFRATIDVFGYKPRASAAQFASSSGFAVVKMTTVLDVLAHVEAMEVEARVIQEPSSMAGNRTSDNHTPAVPTLLELCCRTVDSLTIINLDNALDVLHFGRSHSIPALIQRGEAFIVNSFSGLTTKHRSDTLAAVIGEPSYSRLR